MQTLSYKEQENGLITARIRGICRKVGKVGQEKDAVYGTFVNTGNGIVQYEGYANHDEFLDDLIYIGAIETEEYNSNDRYGLVEAAQLLNINIFN